MGVEAEQSLVERGVYCVRNSQYFSSNTYVVKSAESNFCFVVDPGLDGSLLEEYIDTHSLEPKLVVCTHGHFDHIGSASLLKKKYGARIAIHSKDLPLVKGSNFLMMAFKVKTRIDLPKFDVMIKEEKGIVEFEGQEIIFEQTPGHSGGSCVIKYQDVVFTGDTLYSHGVGLVSLPGENVDKLMSSLFLLWQSLPEDSLVCPGHGGPDVFSRIKSENSALKELLHDFDLENAGEKEPVGRMS